MESNIKLKITSTVNDYNKAHAYESNNLCEKIKKFIQDNDDGAIPVIDIVDGEVAGPSGTVNNNFIAINDDELDDLVEEQLVLSKIKEMQNARKHFQTSNTEVAVGACEVVTSQSRTACGIQKDDDDDSLFEFVTAEENCNEDGKLLDQADKISKALMLNVVMQSELTKLEFNLLNKLKENQKLQSALNEEINRKFLCNDKTHFKRFTKCYYMKFGMPYFKDEHSFRAPVNADYRNMKLEDQVLVCNKYSKIWRYKEKTVLEGRVKENIVHEKSEKFISQERMLKAELMNECSKERVKVILSELAVINTEIQNINKKSLVELFSTYPSDTEFDWMNVCKFVTLHSAEECQRMWHLYAKPTINKNQWAVKEDNKLCELVKKYNDQDWERIAKELKTNRTGYQCFVNYQTRLSKSLKKLGKWAPEEDKTLNFLVSKCKVGNYIPWPKIAYYFQGRSLTQIYCRWTSSLNPDLKKGRFSKDEDRMIGSFVKQYGADFTKISRLVGDRTSAQLRERYFRAKPAQYLNSGRWSYEEDSLLLSLVKKYGVAKWSTLSKHFVTRTRTQIRQRYKAICNVTQKNPNLEVSDICKNSTATSQTIPPVNPRKLKKSQYNDKKKLSELIKENRMKEIMLKSENNLLLNKIRCGRKKMVKRSEIDTRLINYFKETYTNDKLKLKTKYLKPGIDEAAKAMLLFCQFMQTHIPASENETNNLPPTLRQVFQKMIKLKSSNWGCNCLNGSSTVSHSADFSVNCIDCSPTKQEDTVISDEDHLLPELLRISKDVEKKPKNRETKGLHFMPHYLPPSIITSVGFRTMLLIKDKLVTCVAVGKKRYGFFPNSDTEIQNSKLKKFTGYFSEETDGSSDEKENADNEKPSNCMLASYKHSGPVTSVTLTEIPSTSKENLFPLVSNMVKITDLKNICFNENNAPQNDDDDVEKIENSLPERLSEREAINLWKERLMAIFGWPIVLSNHCPDFSSVDLNRECESSDFINEQDTNVNSFLMDSFRNNCNSRRVGKKRKSDMENCPIMCKIAVKLANETSKNNKENPEYIITTHSMVENNSNDQNRAVSIECNRSFSGTDEQQVQFDVTVNSDNDSVQKHDNLSTKLRQTRIKKKIVELN